MILKIEKNNHTKYIKKKKNRHFRTRFSQNTAWQKFFFLCGQLKQPLNLRCYKNKRTRKVHFFFKEKLPEALKICQLPNLLWILIMTIPCAKKRCSVSWPQNVTRLKCNWVFLNYLSWLLLKIDFSIWLIRYFKNGSN